jgi:6-phosphogluconate dehydrogenase (decarboxylating)
MSIPSWIPREFQSSAYASTGLLCYTVWDTRKALSAPLISAALCSRFASRGNEEYAAKLLSAMRYEFGGHVERAAGKPEVA